MTDPILMHSQPTLLAVPPGEVQSWRGRLLTWIYPNRGWAGPRSGPQAHERKKVRPMPDKSAGLPAGGTK